ncbi:non-ribosomal peptide synthetase-like protein [Skermanella aerolata]|uniref:Pls/PosA family non-ribosomal peptide synthetase n=1 Tax=Skermanella aerolata TaxID=393310 RepID=UPI003D1AF480
MNQIKQNVVSEVLLSDISEKISTPIRTIEYEPEKVLTCPGYDSTIRWRPGERLNHLFEQKCAQLQEENIADHLAISTDDVDLSYIDLNHQAEQLARFLVQRGLTPNDRVGLIFSKSVWTFIAMLAVMKANAVYVPLDPSFPKDRISFIAEDADIKLFLSMSTLRTQLGELPATVIWLDEEQPLTNKEIYSTVPGTYRIRPDEPAMADGICYIIYTSGSTGKPKGVAVEHSSICNFVKVAAEVYGLTQEDRVYQGMTIAFDFSVEEIWVPLYSGATLIPSPPGHSLVGMDLAVFLKTKRITALCCVPTLLATIDEDLPTIRFILVSGEACPHNLTERWHKEGRTFLNVYGPTEATVTATWTALHPHKPVTIGVPLPTYLVIILDPAESRVVQKGAVGEICIAGIGLAKEYVNRPDLTMKAFIPDFLGLDNNPSGRIYRTGDLGRLTEVGEIEYLGRIDTQVKIRGYRIELAEIESVLMKVPGIAQAVVSTFEPTPGMIELVAYYTVRQSVDDIKQDEIVDAIRGHLPAYMLPTFFEKMAALPMLPSDKVDRKKLPPPAGPRYLAKRKPYVAPANDIEREVGRVLSDLLNIEQLSMDDHFFNDLGANSLLMAKFCATIREQLHFSDVSMREVYLHPTTRDFSSFVATKARRKSPTVRSRPIHIASNSQYYVCGALQLLFLTLYSTAIFAGIANGYNWVSQTSDAGSIYLRSVIFGGATFLILAAIPIGLKWLLIGKWREDRIPIWSLQYVRFWIVKQLIQANPMVMFVGSPLYNIYLRMLGAKIGRDVVIFSRVVHACPDLLSIGDGTIIRKDSVLAGYRAHSGFIETGRISIGRNVFIGEATVLDIGTSVGDGAQLGHSSSLHTGQSVSPYRRYHGSPAQETEDNYNTVEARPCGTLRRAAFCVAQLTVLLGFSLPLPIIGIDILFGLLGFGTGTTIAAYADQSFYDLSFQVNMVALSLGLFFGMIIVGLLSVVALPRLLSLFIKENETYPLYGFHFLLFQSITKISNHYFYNLLFGDSSYIIYYLRAIGYKISLKDQTGSNFGIEQKHDTPFLCDIGRGTLISDGLSMINADISNSSFRLRKISVPANSFLGNNVFYPADGKVGENCLLGTKVMVPISGPERSGVGLLGSPCFEIPRSVVRDKQFEHYKDGPTFKDRLSRKNMSNTITIVLFLIAQWFFVHLVTLLTAFEMQQYYESGWVSLLDFMMIFLIVSILYFALIERASLGFSRLQPQFCSIYDDYYWKHERYWKFTENPYLNIFSGMPLKGFIWRLYGVKVGKKLFDDGVGIPERTLVSIGDHCTINQMVILQSHSLENGTFKSDHIHIGNDCTIGWNAFVHYGVKMEGNVALDADSFLMKGEHLTQNSTWRGNPAREVQDPLSTEVNCAPENSQQHLAQRRHG